MSERQTSRPGKIKRTLLSVAAAGVMGTACDWQYHTPQQPLTSVENLITGPEKLEAIIEELPPSPIKNLLLERALIYFRQPARTIGNVEFRLEKPTVSQKTWDKPQVYGEFTPRLSSGISPEFFYPRNDTSRLIPYFFELEQPYQTVQVNFSRGVGLATGFRPSITITTPRSEIIQPQYRDLLHANEKFVFTKEACTVLFFDLLLEKTIMSMEKEGLPTHIEVISRDGQTTLNIEFLSQALGLLNNQDGRTKAIIDIAGYVLALKALQDTEVANLIIQDPKIRTVLPDIQAIDLGKTPDELFFKTFVWILLNPQVQMLPHLGDIDKLP